jgi:nitrous oxidase accessory protein NosD
MKKPLLLSLSFVLLWYAAARPALAQDSDDADSKPPILVDDDKVQCPTAAFTTIQAAVNAANPGDHIRVCPGTYAEQVTIDKSLHIRGDNGAIVIPSNVTTSTTSPSGTPLSAIIFVKDATGVSIRGLIVDGSNNGITECAPALIGILYQNASGTIAHNAVKHMQLVGANLAGCQSGDAIFVESAGGRPSNVEVFDNSVWDYQKNGITANESGTQATINGNSVTGIGPTTGAAQNGIQIGFGATGSVTNNSIADNIWATCTPAVCSTNATGILIFESNGIDVENNEVGSNQIGVFIGGDHSVVRANNVFNSVVLIGVALVGNHDRADDNKITHSDQAAVLVQGNNDDIRNNEITDAPVGILKIAGSVGTERSGNRFFDTRIPVQDPAPPKNMSVSPSR